MRKKVIGLLLSLTLIVSSGISVCAEETITPVEEYGQTEDVSEAVEAESAEALLQEEEPVEVQSGVLGGLYLNGHPLVQDGALMPDMPQGVSVDLSTSTLTLSNYSEGGQLNIDEMNGGFCHLKLEGTNVLSDIYSALDDFYIEGSGTVDTTGILVDGNLTMTSGTVNIIGETDESPYSTFYGINTRNFKGGSDYHFLGGNVNIQSGDVNSLLVGIDCQGGNIEIADCNINIELGNSRENSIFGIASGWSSGTSHYGGDVSIENSNVKIKIGSGRAIDHSMYCYNISVTENENVYIGEKGPSRKVTTDQAIVPDSDIMNRFVCSNNYLAVTTETLPIEEEVVCPFTDVTKGSWYYDTVNYVNVNGLMTGLDATTFGPNQNLARAQFATILHRIEGSPEIAYTGKFPDVPDGQYYTSPVLWASNAGVVGGYLNGYFGPADNINREQMAVMMYRYAKYKGYDVSAKNDLSAFPDKEDVSSYATEAMQWAVGAGLITGDRGNVNPQGTANRAVCATIIMRFRNAFK